MKNIEKSLPTLIGLVCLVGLFHLTSCTKEEMGSGIQFHATMEDYTSQNDKTALNGTSINWETGDQIAIYGTTGCGIYTATPQTPANTAIFDNVSGNPGNATYRAFYPATLTNDGVNITLPATQLSVDGSLTNFPMYAESNNNQLAFKNLCGVLKLHLTKENTEISNITITAQSVINGNYTISYVGSVPELHYVGGGCNTTTLNCTTTQSINDGKDFYIYLPAGNYSNLIIELSTRNDANFCIKKTKTNVTVNINRGQYTTITFDDEDLDFIGNWWYRNILPKQFYVSDNSKVCFSTGNLQYNPSGNTWRFAKHQWSIIGTHNNISNSYTGWIDLFGWGTGNNPLLVYNSTFVDWGTNNIPDGFGGGMPWRTLSLPEWSYLLDHYTYGTATVNSTPGLVILPSDWILPSGCSFNSGLNGWNNNNYSIEQWEQMELAGAVFLPAAGYRLGESIAMNEGQYWTSTPYSSYSAGALFFGANSSVTISYPGLSYTSLFYGCAVRLVLNRS